MTTIAQRRLDLRIGKLRSKANKAWHTIEMLRLDLYDSMKAQDPGRTKLIIQKIENTSEEFKSLDGEIRLLIGQRYQKERATNDTLPETSAEP